MSLMSPATDKYLIVNADDFGQSRAINAGIIQAHTQGIVTSASLMVRFPDAVDAAQLARRHPQLSVGLHFDLGEWACHDGEWSAVYTVADDDDEAAVEAAVRSQLDAFRDLMGRHPTHIDSHQHVHRHGPARKLLATAARTLGVPLRGTSSIAYRGDFYGQTAKGHPMPQTITVEALCRFIAGLPAGTTEMGCHPGLADPAFNSMYRDERPLELATLCSPEVRHVIATNAVQLCSFSSAPEHA